MILADSTVTAIFALSVVTAPLCILTGALRFVSARRNGRNQTIEDWLAYGAIVIHLVYVSISFATLAFINGRTVFEIPPDGLLYIGRLSYAVSPLFAVNQMFTKTSILLLYYRIFGINRSFVRWIYVIGAIEIAWFVAVLPVFLFSCRPISRGWDLMQPGTCIDYNASVAGFESINSGVDFAMVVLAMFMIAPLQTSGSTKFKLGIIFAVGAIAGIVGIVKIIETYTFNEVGINFSTALWTIVQMACSIICSCAPTYKPILPNSDFIKRIAANISTFASQSLIGSSIRSKSSQVFHSNGSGKGDPSTSVNSTSRSQGWLELDENKPRWNATTEIGSAHDKGRAKDPDIQRNTIKIQRSIEVV